MIVSAALSRPETRLAAIAVELRVSALGRPLFARELQPLRKIGQASEIAVKAGIVRKRPTKVTGAARVDRTLNANVTALAITRVEISPTDSSWRRRSWTVDCAANARSDLNTSRE